MMSLFRRFAKSWVAGVLMVLLIVSFAIWGISDAFHRRISNAVVKAGSRQISPAEFKKAFDDDLKQLAQQNGGQAISAQDAVAQGFDRQVLQSLADRESFIEMIRREGLRATDRLFAKQLHNFPAFFNPVTGQFDEQTYQRRLADAGYTPAMFERELRDQMVADQFNVGMMNGVRAPRIYTALIAGFTLQNRGADFLVLEPKSVGMPAKPTDAQLTQFMKQHEAQLRQPEFRLIKLVRFSAGALAPTMTADPAAVQKRYDFEKDRLTTPEKRAFVQVPAKDPAQAAAIADRLRKGEDPNKVAASVGAKAIVYPDTAKTEVADPKVADAVFALTQPGQVTGPVQGGFGYAVAKLTGVTPAKAAVPDAVRPQVEAEVKQEAAQEKVYDQVQKYDDAHASGATLDQAAAKVGAKVYALPPMSADGKTPDGQPVQGMNQKMVQDAFALQQGGDTDAVDLGKGEYYALRVEKVIPSAMPPLDAIRPQLTAEYMREELIKTLEAKAEALAARVRKGEPLQAVAASAGATVQHATGLNQANASQHQELGRDFLVKLFQTKAGDVFTAGASTGIAVAKVSQLQNAPAADVGRLAAQGRSQLTMQMEQNEFQDMIRQAARQIVKPKVDEALARSALGLSDDTTPASGAPAKK